MLRVKDCHKVISENSADPSADSVTAGFAYAASLLPGINPDSQIILIVNISRRYLSVSVCPIRSSVCRVSLENWGTSFSSVIRSGFH